MVQLRESWTVEEVAIPPDIKFRLGMHPSKSLGRTWQKYTASIAPDGALTEIPLRKPLGLGQDVLYIYTSEVLAYYSRKISTHSHFRKFQEECTAGGGTCVAVRSVLSRWLFQTCVTHDCSTIHLCKSHFQSF